MQSYLHCKIQAIRDLQWLCLWAHCHQLVCKAEPLPGVSQRDPTACRHCPVNHHKTRTSQHKAPTTQGHHTTWSSQHRVTTTQGHHITGSPQHKAITSQGPAIMPGAEGACHTVACMARLLAVPWRADACHAVARNA
eukprot:1156026-Pelagomonas_calceolata.AAC.5